MAKVCPLKHCKKTVDLCVHEKALLSIGAFLLLMTLIAVIFLK